MSILQRASYAFLLRHPIQMLLALLGIATGVAVIVAVDLANSSANTAFRMSVDTITGEATHQIVGGPAGVDEKLYAELRVNHGVTGIAPVVETIADIENESLQVLGIDPFAEREFRDYVLPSGDADTSTLTTLLTKPGAILMSAERAEQWGLVTGDTLPLKIDGVQHTAVLAAVIIAPDRKAQLRNLLITDIATAQYWTATEGRLSRIDVRSESTASQVALRALLPAGVQFLDAAGRTDTILQMTRAFNINLTAMSLLALLVGMFLIYNSVSFTVLQRRTMISVLRALGLTRAGLFRLILSEAILLGIAGAALGVLAGVLLGESLLQLVSQSLNDLYFRSSVTSINLETSTLLKGFAAGVLATCAAAVVPTAEAASYTPRLAMQRASLERRTGAMLWGLAATGLMLALAVVPLLHYSGQSLVAGLVALFMLVMGIALCIPLLMRGILYGCARVAGVLAGDLSRLSVAGIAANLSRTGVAIVALSVAVSATIGVSIMVGSFRAAVSTWVDQSLQADLYVAPVSGSLRPELVSKLRKLPGVENFSSRRSVWLESMNDRFRLIVLDLAPQSYAGIEFLDTVPGDIWQAFNGEGAVLVSEPFAYRQGLGPGDAVRLPTERGDRAFLIGATYRSYDSQPDAIIMSRPIYDLFWDDPVIDSMGIYLTNVNGAETTTAAIHGLADNLQALQVRSNADLRQFTMAIFDRTFLITNVLYWLAVCVAVVGILAALLAMQMERSRELATLRALGVTRAQLAGMVTLQSGVIGLLSGLCAIPLGWSMARLLIEVINRRAFGWSMPMQVDTAVLWHAILLATGAALLAGIYPAWRATHSQPALAMRED